ncbi:uncharacterized protein EI90DRAFT_3289200 [Cantharellus anzutake]|uniref:uncharacterized protein n=1 Tax=Cantharellus anzutake TaxID=1750568 RepID=UPI001907A251|nr:uncharacterized protein EI90DRAFT_3289200 [Cantharellus anzutake]KAF8331966.1 hypothetical protein EI90DRAFT_3289200 [Cantharellus anzutake]
MQSGKNKLIELVSDSEVRMSGLSRTGQNLRERRFGPAKKFDFDGDLAPEYIFTPRNSTSARESKQDANQTFLSGTSFCGANSIFDFAAEPSVEGGLGSYFSFGVKSTGTKSSYSEIRSLSPHEKVPKDERESPTLDLDLLVVVEPRESRGLMVSNQAASEEELRSPKLRKRASSWFGDRRKKKPSCPSTERQNENSWSLKIRVGLRTHKAIIGLGSELSRMSALLAFPMPISLPGSRRVTKSKGLLMAKRVSKCRLSAVMGNPSDTEKRAIDCEESCGTIATCAPKKTSMRGAVVAKIETKITTLILGKRNDDRHLPKNLA